VFECTADGSFIVANWLGRDLVKLSRDGSKAEVVPNIGLGKGEFIEPMTLTVLPGSKMVVRDYFGARIQVFHCLQLRREWVKACATLATREWRAHDSTAKRARDEGLA
jgi:hypothetical protein